MPTLYTIRDWANRYEDHCSRKLKTIYWFPMPIQLDGDDYTALMEHEDGPALFGVATALLCVAARCKPRGTLVRENGKAHDANSLARLTRVPTKLMQRALSVLSSQDIGWLEAKQTEKDTVPAVESAVASADPVPSSDCTIDLRVGLNNLYGRQVTDTWSNMEEHLLIQTARRRDVMFELGTILAYRTSIPMADRSKFFPQSIVKLLEHWTEVLDRARQKNISPTRPADREARNAVKQAENL